MNDYPEQCIRRTQARARVRLAGCVVACVALVAALVWTFRANQDDMRAEQTHYCKMVQTGAWPDFRHSYEESCPTQRPRKERSNE